MNLLQTLFGGSQQPKQNFTPAPSQKINLVEGGSLQGQLQNIAATQPANQARLRAQQQLGFTTGFAENVANANPFVANVGQNGNLSKGKRASAEYINGNQLPYQIALGSKNAQPTTVLHEGLHRIWDTNPQVRSQFDKAYDSSSTSQLRQWLQGRVAPYRSAQKLMDDGGVYTNDFSRIESLPSDLQNEIHSYIPEYYSNFLPYAQSRSPQRYAQYKNFNLVSGDQNQPVVEPNALAEYYKQYYNTNARLKR